MEAAPCAHVGTLVEDRAAGTVCTSCGLIVSCVVEEGYCGSVAVATQERGQNGPGLNRRDVEFVHAACERLLLPSDEYRARIDEYVRERKPKVYQRNRRAFLAALIVMISRAMSHPRIPKEVALYVGLRREDVYREVKGIERAMQHATCAFDDQGVAMGRDIVPRILSALFAEEPSAVPPTDRRKIMMRARCMADEIEDSLLLSGRTPSTIAAVAVYETNFSEGGPSGWSKVQVAKAAHLSSCTLAKAISAYGNGPST